MFNSKQPQKQYKISLKSPNGNTAGFINLTDQFTNAVLGKQAENVTLADLVNFKAPNFPDIQTFLASFTIVMEETLPKTVLSAEDF